MFRRGTTKWMAPGARTGRRRPCRIPPESAWRTRAFWGSRREGDGPPAVGAPDGRRAARAAGVLVRVDCVSDGAPPMTSPAGAVSVLRASGDTDAGLQRDVNEDRFHIDLARGLFMVIDGVGGQA